MCAIALGKTTDHITAGFWESLRKAMARAKKIFFNTDLKMKVTVTNGEVSSIE